MLSNESLPAAPLVVPVSRLATTELVAETSLAVSKPVPPLKMSLPGPASTVSSPAPVRISSSVLTAELLMLSLPLPVCSSKRSMPAMLTPLIT